MDKTMKLLTSEEMLARFQSHPVSRSEIPVEHYKSLPLPTLRWGGPAYAIFTSPSVRIKGEPMRQSPPDRWCLFSATGGKLILYSLCAVVPFTQDTAWEPATLPTPSMTVAQMKQSVQDMHVLLAALAPPFFSGEAGDAGQRRAFQQAFVAFVPEPIVQQYKALAPDFFEWLGA